MSTVNEVLETMTAKTNDKGNTLYNRFSKKNFEDLVTAMLNDVDFKERIVKKVNTDSCELEDVMVTKEFRKWLKKVVEKLGVDSTDSKVILTSDFQFDDAKGVYDFMTSAIYQYMTVGNKFDIPAHEDLKGSMYIKDVAESVKETNARNPKDGSFLGTYECKKKKHRVLAAKSSCPTYLSEKRKIK